jgi:hypothetical protein
MFASAAVLASQGLGLPSAAGGAAEEEEEEEEEERRSRRLLCRTVKKLRY